MAQNITDLNSKRPHWSGAARCRSNPEHKWAAVVPEDANPFSLVCPICGGTMRSGYIIASTLSMNGGNSEKLDFVQTEYEKVLGSLNMMNAFLMTALYQATDGKQGMMAVSMEKIAELQ